MVLRDSKGCEPGGPSDFKALRELIEARLCTGTRTAGSRIFETGNEKLLQYATKRKVRFQPLVFDHDTTRAAATTMATKAAAAIQ